MPERRADAFRAMRVVTLHAVRGEEDRAGCGVPTLGRSGATRRRAFLAGRRLTRDERGAQREDGRRTKTWRLLHGLVVAAALVASPFLSTRALGAPESGKQLYETSCASCHGTKGQGSSAGPSLIGRSAADIHLMLDTGRMPAPIPFANELHKQPRFTYAEMTRLVAYVQSFSPHPDTSLPFIMPGDAHHGRRLFAENCAVCHGPAADGASVGSSNVAPSLLNATVFQVAEAIRAGPGIMPRFGPDVLSDRDVDDIVRYVNALQTDNVEPAEDPGGVSLAHVGPVAEGLVAWVFGIGVLTLVVVAIAATTERREG